MGLTLGQVSSTLSFQPAVDGLVLPPSWQQKLQALPCTVVLDDPEEEDDGDRYVAVSE